MRLSFVKSQLAPASFRARWLMVSPDRILENHFLETRDNRVTAVTATSSTSSVRDLGPGLIMPLLINAHIHLELSALKNKLPFDQGFEKWVAALLEKREALGQKALKQAAKEEVEKLITKGTGAVAEISTLGITRDLLRGSALSGVWFQEILGSEFDPGNRSGSCESRAGQGQNHAKLAFSLAGHAPHTTAPEVLKQAKAYTMNHGLPFSIHLAESMAESAFINGEQGGWADFLASRGISIEGWPIGDKSPVAYLNALGILGPQTLGVHLLNTDQNDLDILSRTGTKLCLCPRSNMNLHQSLPDLPRMLEMGLSPALGTDSLASCSSLNLFDEMAFIRQHYPGVSAEAVLTMATINSAHALGMGPVMGSLDKGGWSGFLYIDLDSQSPNDILESLTHNDF